MSKLNKDFLSNMSNMFLNQEAVDCFFELPNFDAKTNSVSGKKVIGAHKIILAAASPVFYSLLIEEHTFTKKPRVIEVPDVYFDDFKWFLWIIYNQRSTSLKDCALMYPSRLYKLGHKYACGIVVDVAKEEIKSHIGEQPALAFVYMTLARHLGCIDVATYCIQVLKTKTSEILKTEQFLRTKPCIVAEIFSWDRMNIESEYELVVALENYLDVNPNTALESVDMKKAKGCIRWLLLTEAQIFATNLLDYKEKTIMLYCRGNSDNQCMKDMPHLSFERKPRMKLC